MPTNKNNLFTVVWSIPKAHASSDKESVKRSLSKISKKFNLKLELESEETEQGIYQPPSQ